MERRSVVPGLTPFAPNRAVTTATLGGQREVVIDVADLDEVIGFMVTWVIRESHLGFGGSAGSPDVDDALNALATLVRTKLDDRALERARRDVRLMTGLRRDTRLQIFDTLRIATLKDPDFDHTLQEAVTRLQELTADAEEPPDPSAGVTNTISGTVHGTVVQARDIHGDINFGR